MSGKFMMNGIEYLGGGSGGGGGNVDDVYVNGESVLDENKIAQVTSYKEVTLAEYMALPDTKLTDGIMYCIKDVGGANQFPPLIYSDEEREVGVWRDGKPLYQKTFVAQKTTVGVETLLDLTNLNIESCIQTTGWFINSGATHSYMPYFTSSSDFAIAFYQGGYLRGYNGGDHTKSSWNITLQYTKTTDTPGSGTWTTDGTYAHHYSTSEKVIGTWIDGKPLYEKTFTGLSQSIRSKDWNVITGISIPNIKDAINVRAIRLAGSGNLADIGLIEYASNVNSQSVQVNPIDTQTLNYLIVQYTKTTD